MIGKEKKYQKCPLIPSLMGLYTQYYKSNAICKL